MAAVEARAGKRASNTPLRRDLRHDSAEEWHAKLGEKALSDCPTSVYIPLFVNGGRPLMDRLMRERDLIQVRETKGEHTHTEFRAFIPGQIPAAAGINGKKKDGLL